LEPSQKDQDREGNQLSLESLTLRLGDPRQDKCSCQPMEADGQRAEILAAIVIVG